MQYKGHNLDYIFLSQQCFLCCVVWRYEGSIHVYALLWVVFGDIYVVNNVREGGYIAM